MSDDNEFKDVKKGLPSETTQQDSKKNFLLIFLVVGGLLALLIIVFGDAISQASSQLSGIPQQVINTGILALLVGGVQSAILKTHIKNDKATFVTLSGIGGVLGGIVGGIMVTVGLSSGLMLGVINGAIAGCASSFFQNKMLNNKKYAEKWLGFSLISWAISFSLGWTISFGNSNIYVLAFAALVIMIASGISLIIFINNTPEIEFS